MWVVASPSSAHDSFGISVLVPPQCSCMVQLRTILLFPSPSYCAAVVGAPLHIQVDLSLTAAASRCYGHGTIWPVCVCVWCQLVLRSVPLGCTGGCCRVNEWSGSSQHESLSWWIGWSRGRCIPPFQDCFPHVLTFLVCLANDVLHDFHGWYSLSIRLVMMRTGGDVIDIPGSCEVREFVWTVVAAIACY